MEDDSPEAKAKRKEEWRAESLKCKNKCGENRRSGSAYCQTCSNKHNASYEPLL